MFFNRKLFNIPIKFFERCRKTTKHALSISTLGSNDDGCWDKNCWYSRVASSSKLCDHQFYQYCQPSVNIKSLAVKSSYRRIDYCTTLISSYPASWKFEVTANDFRPFIIGVLIAFG